MLGGASHRTEDSHELVVPVDSGVVTADDTCRDEAAELVRDRSLLSVSSDGDVYSRCIGV